MESVLLSVKVFGHFGTRVRCCVEISSEVEDSSLSESGKEDSGGNDEGVKREDADSDSG